jgi:organic radical activating enzyme
MPSQTAAISEIFSSLQGEGTHLGERHLFLRFEACNIHCEYCDELGKPGFDFDLGSTLESLKRLNLEFGPHAFLSFTGGEPLLYTPFIKMLLPHLKELNLKAYLETNGILAKLLREVIDQVDVVAMDVKPASVTKERSFLKEHEEFLNISVQKETFIKMVCSEEIELNEFVELCTMIGRVNPKIPLILQPISTDMEGHENPALMNLLGELQSVGLGILKDVRIIPRLHKILKIR